MKFNKKDYDSCIKILRKKINESKLDLQILEYDNSRTIELSYPYNISTFENCEIELQKICFETGFYRFVTNEGSDIGPFSPDKNENIQRSYFYNLEENYVIWDDFDKEYILFKNKINAKNDI